VLMNSEHGSGGASQALDFVPIFFEQREDLVRAPPAPRSL